MSAFRTMFLALIGAVFFLSSAFAETSPEGLAFLNAKAKEKGVVTLPSGLIYKVVKSGGGKTPLIDSSCECNYVGHLIDGTEFDNSYKRGKPATFAPNQVIKGWTEALMLMKEGDVWDLFVPSELGYGDRGAGNTIPGGSVLIFKIELLKVLGGHKEL